MTLIILWPLNNFIQLSQYVRIDCAVYEILVRILAENVRQSSKFERDTCEKICRNNDILSQLSVEEMYKNVLMN